ncbi:type IX secretion system membrane protein PorP/SprF [Sphingobacterium sp. SGG-5]|uniref:PorP/SprF family type IX secretion system membrane protein n=1 Tax=Sphingobacterium sp. SGG-5 TaxID=2710881 RepID=UPI0013ED05B8|nr:PorP/SprF family type IX secretion system membrane protein [Sphingobacterium sp. SGG-5]NGM62522.1 type IX secretion system membrane protein PorP/SprF [Sphingobacterium sp. SGG-5]
MKMIQRNIVILFCALWMTADVYGQQEPSTQYILNSMSVNPAYTGYKEQWYGQLGVSSQWSGWEGTPFASSLAVDGVLDPVEKKHGVGLQVTNDRFGAESVLSAYANYALRLKLSADGDERLSLGLAAGITQYGLNGDKFSSVEQDDALVPTDKQTTMQPDLRLGVYYHNPHWFVGLSVQDLFNRAKSEEGREFVQNSLGNTSRNPQSYLMGGALVRLASDVVMRSSALIQEDFERPTTLDVNTVLIFGDKLWTGIGYRTKAYWFTQPDNVATSNTVIKRSRSLNAILLFAVNQKFRIGYSYDHQLGNRTSGAKSGVHGVTLGVSFGKGQHPLAGQYF